MKRYALVLAALLLGSAFAKNKSQSDFPITIAITGAELNTQWTAAPSQIPYGGANNCYMTIATDTQIMSVHSNGFCHTFSPGTVTRARLSGSVIEITWSKGDGKIKSGKYVIAGITMRK